MNDPSCRFCGHSLRFVFLDLGRQPLVNAFLKREELSRKEPTYPLTTYVCEECFLVQSAHTVSPEDLFSHYFYFSSYSESWLKHAENFALEMIQRFQLKSHQRIVEVASNDGYLLQFFREKGFSVLGIEPAQNIAEAARSKGIPTVAKFFGLQTALELESEGHAADLLIGNNVLAHVPDLNDFVKGLKSLLKPKGVLTLEFPHLLKLLEKVQFDTLYHEHFSYFSFGTVERILEIHGLVLFDVAELSTHGGSLRIYARHREDDTKPLHQNVEKMRKKEIQAGLNQLKPYQGFEGKAQEVKRRFLEFLIQAKKEGKKIAAYGAPAKGVVLLNYCGIREDFIEYTVDLNPNKQNCFLPGSHIPIYAPEKVLETRPDYLVILPWNLKDEIMKQMNPIKEWGGKFVIPIPQVEVIS